MVIVNDVISYFFLNVPARISGFNPVDSSDFSAYSALAPVFKIGLKTFTQFPARDNQIVNW